MAREMSDSEDEEMIAEEETGKGETGKGNQKQTRPVVAERVAKVAVKKRVSEREREKVGKPRWRKTGFHHIFH